MAQFPKSEKVEFRNNTSGYIGVVTYAPNGDEKAVAVEPDGTVWLSVEEQELTAKAPRSAKDNPFIVQREDLLDPETGEKIGERAVTPLTLNTEVRPVPGNNTRPIPGTGKLRPGVEDALAAMGDAPDGSHAANEEIGTPSAQKPAAARRRRPPAKATVKK